MCLAVDSESILKAQHFSPSLPMALRYVSNRPQPTQSKIFISVYFLLIHCVKHAHWRMATPTEIISEFAIFSRNCKWIWYFFSLSFSCFLDEFLPMCVVLVVVPVTLNTAMNLRRVISLSSLKRKPAKKKCKILCARPWNLFEINFKLFSFGWNSDPKAMVAFIEDE